MQSGREQPWRVGAADGLADLGFQVLPALRPYGVARIEVCYEIVHKPQVIGVQFRDARGLRVERLAIPATLAASFESCVSRCVESALLSDGQGVVSIDLAQGRIVLQHQPTSDAISASRLEFRT
jgi:hypothetical protein